jgi:hypothetical protein
VRIRSRVSSRVKRLRTKWAVAIEVMNYIIRHIFGLSNRFPCNSLPERAPSITPHFVQLGISEKMPSSAFFPFRVVSPFSLSMVDMRHLRMITSIQVPGRTRWTVFDERAQVFYVNIPDPAQIVVVASADPARVRHTIAIFGTAEFRWDRKLNKLPP